MFGDADVAAMRGFRTIYGPNSLPGIGLAHSHVVEAIIAGVETLKGAAAAERLRADGVGALHTVIDAGDVGELRELVLEPLRNQLLKLAVEVGRAAAGWKHDFFVDDYLILRINLPFEVAREATAHAENPGVGRLSPSVRAVATDRRVRDPVYDPASYHAGYPPAAWAHGPHIDSWTGHSRDGLNLWWSIGETPAEAGMVLYDGLDPSALPFEPRTLYLRSGVALPPPTLLPLRAGEMLVFDPEILHGTHLNVAGSTRVAVSMRLNARQPRFDPRCFYAREFWRRSEDIEADRFDRVLHLPREENLDPPQDLAVAAETPLRPVVLADEPDADGWRLVKGALGPADDDRQELRIGERRLALWRTDGRIHATDAACPHYGLSLLDGGVDAAHVHCPGCAVAFDLATGASACRQLRLATYPVEERDGGVWVKVSERAS